MFVRNDTDSVIHVGYGVTESTESGVITSEVFRSVAIDPGGEIEVDIVYPNGDIIDVIPWAYTPEPEVALRAWFYETD
jgi:hypothetical protein